MLCSVLSTYLNAAKAAATDSPEDTAQQLAAAESYSEQLLENGGGPADDDPADGQSLVRDGE